MADRQGALAGVSGRRMRVYYDDAGTYRELQGIGSMEIASGQAQAQTYQGFEGELSEAGAPEVGAVTFEVSSYAPQHPSWQWMQSQLDDAQNVTIRAESREVTVSPVTSGAMTAAIATTGVVTFAGSYVLPAEVARGHCIKIGTNLYVIQSISDADTPVVTVGPSPNSAVSAANFSIVFPILRWQISGQISQMPGGSVGTDTLITGSFGIQPSRRVALPTPQAAHSVA